MRSGAHGGQYERLIVPDIWTEYNPLNLRFIRRSKIRDIP